MDKRKPTLLKLFTSTLLLSAFTLGGGYVIVPLMKKKFADELGWLCEDEILELVALGQSAPGAMAINVSVLLGWRFFGLPGALLGALATALPPLLILTGMYYLYDYFRANAYAAALFRGMQSGIAAIIISAVWDMAKCFFNVKRIPSVLIIAAAFCAAWFYGVNVAYIIIASGLTGAVAAVVIKKWREMRA